MFAIFCAQEMQAPVSRYVSVKVGDFLALVSPDAEKSPVLLQQTLSLLGFRLRQMKNEVPADAYRRLTPIKFWIEKNDPNTPAAVYHPDRDWLIQHGYDAEMAKNVEIGNMSNFLKWQHIQPSMVLHELSHAYHFQVVGSEDPTIGAAYEHAVASGIYNSVPFVTGGRRRAYALTNKFEYFAECSEAFFGRNDFYPFLRSEFKKFDPEGYEAVRKAWKVRSNIDEPNQSLSQSK